MKSGPKLCFITDPLVTTAGSVRPTLLLSRELSKLGYDITIVTTKANEDLSQLIEEMNHKLLAIGPRTSFFKRMPNLDAWLRHIIINNAWSGLHGQKFIVNTSSTSITRSDVYYAQGIMMKALEDMMPGLPLWYRICHNLSKGFLSYCERKTIKKYEKVSKYFIANSRFCARLYEDWGIHIDDVINPPLDTSFFKPSCPVPTEGYILTYFGTLGKESNGSLIKIIADNGIKIKAFGNTPLNKTLLRHKNIDFLGKVTDDELVHLYSNALLTLFAFKHEPFGYIPVESMACSTPVLTYNMQGPSETVINHKTGWLADSNTELLEILQRVWVNGVPQGMRRECVESVRKYSVENIAKQWIRYIDEIN